MCSSTSRFAQSTYLFAAYYDNTSEGYQQMQKQSQTVKETFSFLSEHFPVHIFIYHE